MPAWIASRSRPYYGGGWPGEIIKKWKKQQLHFFLPRQSAILQAEGPRKKMSTQFGLAWLLVLSMASAALSVWGAYRLWQKYRFLFLGSYLFYLLAWNLYGMLGVLTMVVAPLAVPGPAASAVLLVNHILFIPLHGIVSYFFLNLVFGLAGKALPRWFKAGFLALFSLYFTFVLIRDLVVSSPLVIRAYSLAVMGACLVAALIFLHWQLRQGKKSSARRHLLAFELISALGFTLSFLFMMNIMPGIGLFAQSLVTTAVVFGFNLPALWALARYVRLEYGSRPAGQLDEAGFESFCLNFNLSQREGEILERVVKGRSNREIETELFISLDTVKKHLYNIFKKTGVKNRVRLIYLVSSQVSKPEQDR